MWPRWLGRKKPDTNSEADKALRDAEKKLDEIKNRGREVTALAEALKEIREKNHFAEQLEAVFRRKGTAR
jgi:hypothetical protein